jgi:iron complex outermembrane receptor protein
VSAGGDLSPSWRASIDGRYGHFHVEDPGPVSAPLAGSYARVGRGGASLSLDNTYSRTWGYARVFSAHGHHIITDGFRSVDSTTGARVHQSFLVGPELTIEAGTDVVAYGGEARNVISQANFGEHHVTTAAGFTRMLWTPLERLRLNGGVRYDHHTLYGGITAPEAGATWRFSPHYAFSAAVARGFRNPTIRELYLFPAPNPLLEPERVWNYQATFQARPRRDLQAWLTGYYADLTNVVVTTGRYPNLLLLNSGSALNRGLEASARWQPSRRLQWNAGYGWLRSTNLAPYLPANKSTVSLVVDAGKAWFDVGAMVVGRRWANASKSGQLGGYGIATFKCTVPVGSRRSVFLLVDNILNKRYEVIPGYPMPGINAMGGLSLRF